MTLELVPRPLLRDRAYASIRDAIVDGELAPGTVIRDSELAERLGLSRGPVRQALARLRDEGLVESKPQSYTRVTNLVLRDARDALAVVRAMHELAVREGARRLVPGQIDEMRRVNERFAAAVREGSVEGALAADDAFHGVLVEAAGNRAAAATIERYTHLIRRLERQRFTPLPGEGSVRRHERLIDACAAGDVEGAVAVTHEIWSALEDLLDEPDAPGSAGGSSAAAR
ncbi:MAG TPA: GntR family transcriptional regulator [Egibacteraceae bacterium]|nr:GntR family transcriptional regulator [Egibacteraceae bacterium]